MFRANLLPGAAFAARPGDPFARRIHIRLSGIWEPENKQIAAIVSLLENPAYTPVFVHCRRGDDRVGLVIACYRIAHDHRTNERALKEARRDGINVLEILMQRYIRHYHPQSGTPPLVSATGEQ
ncbi:MAG TPA: hypothetical protein VKV17_04540 [Bryobacteraceae bacterium]|nr:hypothetical protein [Bryobacteraceae bacterium]